MINNLNESMSGPAPSYPLWFLMMGLIPYPTCCDSPLFIKTHLTLIIVRTIFTTLHFANIVSSSGSSIIGFIGRVDIVFTILLPFFLLRVAFLLSLFGNALSLVIDWDIGIVGYQVIEDGSELTSLLGEHAGFAIEYLAIGVDAIEVWLYTFIACVEMFFESG